MEQEEGDKSFFTLLIKELRSLVLCFRRRCVTCLGVSVDLVRRKVMFLGLLVV